MKLNPQSKRIIYSTKLFQIALLNCILLSFSFTLKSQNLNYEISGVIKEKLTEKGLPAQIIISGTSLGTTANEQGYYEIKNITQEAIEIKIKHLGFYTAHQKIKLHQGANRFDFLMENSDIEIDEITIEDNKSNNQFSNTHLRSVEGTAVYAGKKSDVIQPDLIAANKANNTARQVFSKISGLNIWESDGAGLQMGIGGRGLSPNRNSNFNVRQGGYDISADALGYPESYYTPPTEALGKIEVVRGAASLQYGTQFGGLVNFVMKKGPADSPFEITHRQTAGSWKMYNNFTSIGGNINKVNYYGFYQYKRGEGWRPNSHYESHTAYASTNIRLSFRATLGIEYSHMSYLAQQPGGLTDTQFEINPKQSLRARNWFKVDWNVLAINYDIKINDKTKINSRIFGLIGARDALGILERINEIDRGQERDLLKDDYLNFGNETRLIHRYKLAGKQHTILTGLRLYNGFTKRKQGFGSKNADADFSFLDQQNPGKSDFEFPSMNYAWFAENIFKIHQKITITPGVRTEYIRTEADGNFNITVKDLADNIVSDTLIPEKRKSNRGILLFGLGASYKPNEHIEVYANFSQNYRAITFSDLRVINPNFKVDLNIEDEKGFNTDIGIRGNYKNKIHYDFSAFLLAYKNRIGLVFVNDTSPPFLPFRFRTNIGESITLGIESFVEFNVLKLIQHEKKNFKLNVFFNFSAIRSTYTESKDSSIVGNKVELVPPITIKTGISATLYQLMISLQYSYVKKHFTDATNAIRTSSAVNGIIPTYYVMDLSLQYPFKWFQIEAGINNLTDNRYFTRRAEAYPGPGIIPSDARNFYIGIQFQFHADKKNAKQNTMKKM